MLSKQRREERVVGIQKIEGSKLSIAGVGGKDLQEMKERKVERYSGECCVELYELC